MSWWKISEKTKTEQDTKPAAAGVLFPVRRRHCDQCLYTERKLVSNERRRQILRECRENDTFFNCHKSTIKGEIACCHGFYKRHPYATSVMRHAAKHKLIHFID